MLSLDLTFKKLKKRGEELCGDTVEIVRDAESTVIVLADGLGSGVKANILATLTAKIIATMIKNHLGIEEVVKTIIETLPVCRLRGIA
ncbi:MAG: serine/threonine-protein phosphatase, partial [Dethiobacter sp.]|nr:serine/threonine-protein phosphatase [Dethiobacter sp.]